MDKSTLRALAVGTALVGIGEELVFRGYVLDTARGSLDERGAWAVSSVVFGAVHGANALTGQSAAQAASQVLLAANTGNSLYIARRWSGSLVLPMALHALWDFSALTMAGPSEEAEPSPINLATIAGTLLGGFVLSALSLRELLRR